MNINPELAKSWVEINEFGQPKKDSEFQDYFFQYVPIPYSAPAINVGRILALFLIQ